MLCEQTAEGLQPIPACFGTTFEEAIASAVEETGRPWSELESDGLVIRRMRIALELGWMSNPPNTKRKKQREKGKHGRRVSAKGEKK